MLHFSLYLSPQQASILWYIFFFARRMLRMPYPLIRQAVRKILLDGEVALVIVRVLVTVMVSQVGHKTL